MIKRVIFVILLIMFGLPFGLAITSDVKEVYLSGETMIIKISGNILEAITPEQVRFVDFSIGYKELALDYNLRKIGDTFYLYAVMPYQQNLSENQTVEYTLLIKDISTTINGQKTKVDFMQNFSISGNVIPYTITPGIIVSSDNFDIKVNLNIDQNLEISTDFPETRTIVLRPGENMVHYSLDGIRGGIYNIKIGEYVIPVQINKEIPKHIPYVRFTKSFIESNVLIGQVQYYEIELRNYGSEDVNNARFEYDKTLIDIFPVIPEIIKAGESYYFNISLINKNSDLNEDIKIVYGNESSDLTLSIRYTSNQSEVGTDYTPTDSSFNQALCSELGGTKCSSNELCSSEIVSSRDQSQCCTGICIESSSGRSYSWIGYIIGTILLIIIVVIGLRYFKSKKQRDNFSQKVRNAESKLIP